ncbi:hypothetical protein OIU84_002974 [Salix udensis]|uniref:Uncharacterized protein n=1 Tax=Salix udensis TaxID=889485 RepID=A0AAD6K5C9_9ROSI|nr:hypothetical protein OIU84_002974 [Salix udensis]
MLNSKTGVLYFIMVCFIPKTSVLYSHNGIDLGTKLYLPNSNVKALSTKALSMSLNPFCTSCFTMLHNAFIP